MSNHHKNRDKVKHVNQHEVTPGSSLVSTFADSKNLDIKNTKDLMNWIIFGDTKTSFDFQPDTNTF
jgi:hypothetical protein